MAEDAAAVQRLDVVLVDRTEVRHDAFVSTEDLGEQVVERTRRIYHRAVHAS